MAAPQRGDGGSTGYHHPDDAGATVTPSSGIPGGKEKRTLAADDAYAILERRALLDYLEVAGELIEIEHRTRP